MSHKAIIEQALSAILTLGLTTVAVAAETMPEMPAVPGQEKCYGIAKAGMNDCGSALHQCAGEAKQDRDPAEYLFVPQGLCNRIVGGSLKPPVVVNKK